METRANAQNTGSTAARKYAEKIGSAENRKAAVDVDGCQCLNPETPSSTGIRRKRDDPRRGVTGVVVGSGSGGDGPNPLSGHGGCNRRGQRNYRRRNLLASTSTPEPTAW